MNRLAPMLVFVAVVTLVFGSWHWYLWLRLVRDAHLPVAAARLALALLVGGGLLVPLGMALTVAFPVPGGRGLAYAAYLWLGFAFYLLMTTGGIDLLRWAGVLALRLAALADRPAPDLRALLTGVAAGRALAATALLLSLVASVTAYLNARGPVAVKEVRVAIPGLPADLDGLTLVQLTDLHIGAPITREFVQDVVDRTNAL
ncbi:MAG: hypothetical protein JXR83_07440, partial [Deltaproteobacteria bacterium]|nr:hypothetical protein [Deltaproteobacteria bacterium]